jgi:hypothetical protein
MYREYYTLKKKEEQMSTSDSIVDKPTIKVSGTKKSVPYGQEKKPH